MFTVAVIDDQPIARVGLTEAISGAPGLTVVAGINGLGEIAEVEEAPIDVAVVRLEAVKDTPVLAAIEKLVARCGVVVISAWDRPPTLMALLRTGVRGFLTRYSDAGAIVSAVTIVSVGGLYLCDGLASRLRSELISGRFDDPAGLAPREAEALRLIALGLTHAQVARRMGLTPATVSTYAKRLRSKLNVGNRADLTRRAIELGHLEATRRECSVA